MRAERPFGEQVTPEWLTIEVDAAEWEPSGDIDPTGRLTLKPFLVFGGLPMHVEAWAMKNDDNGQTADGEWPDDLDHLYGIYDAGGPFATTPITIDGHTRDYLIVIFPHAA
jgi:hypothetical protein